MAFLSGELRENERNLLQAHLDECPACQDELKELNAFLATADVLKEDIREAVESVDWETLPSRITDSVFRKEVPLRWESRLTRTSRFFFQPRLRPVYAALFLGIILGAVLTFVLFRPPQPAEVVTADYFVPQEFMQKVELEMARRETLDYLEKSEFLLLDFIQTPAEKSAELWQGEFVSLKARDLLAKKKYINPQLDNFQMAKAKAICDQIELLFYELSQISVQLSAAEIHKIQRMIEDRQILLKISLVKKELERTGV